MRIVDGGYLSWMYGTRPEFGSWASVRYDYINSIIFMDSSVNARVQLNPLYKQRRRTKEVTKPELRARRAQVEKFQRWLRSDPLLTTYSHPGCEADDLVALTSLLYPEKVTEVIGIDKDYLQVPGLRTKLRTIQLDRINWPLRFQKSFPKGALVSGLHEPDGFLRAQVLLGDKSDSVPRLLPLRNYQLYRELCQQPTWAPLISVFGFQRVFESLQLLLMPGVFLCKDFHLLSPQRLLTQVQLGLYWDPEHFTAPQFIRELEHYAPTDLTPRSKNRLS